MPDDPAPRHAKAPVPPPADKLADQDVTVSGTLSGEGAGSALARLVRMRQKQERSDNALMQAEQARDRDTQ